MGFNEIHKVETLCEIPGEWQEVGTGMKTHIP